MVRSTKFVNPFANLTTEDSRRIRELKAQVNPSFMDCVQILALDPRKSFVGADLRGVDFGSADLSNYDFEGANICDADFSRARNLRAEQLIGCITNEGTKFRVKVQPEATHPAAPHREHSGDTSPLAGLRVICDDVIEPWPLGWQSDIGRFGFFYLAGIREEFVGKGVLSISEIADQIGQYAQHAAESYDPRWGKFYPGFEVLADDYNGDFEKWGLSSLGRNALRAAANCEALTFPKAALTAMAFSCYLSGGFIDFEKCIDVIQIRISAYYIQGLDKILPSLSLEDKARLSEYTLNNIQVFEQLSAGHPTTLPTAQLLCYFLRNETDLGRELGHVIKVSQYASTSEIRNNIKLLKSKSGGKIELRPAKGQSVLI